MIKNLPETFPVSALGKIAFGDAEAREDSLLDQCPVSTAAMSDLLEGKKDIVLGYRGTGKSAIVRLIAEGSIEFRVEQGWKKLVLVLDEEFQYRAFREYLNKNAEAKNSNAISCRVVWELLLLYRLLKFFSQEVDSNDSTIKEYLGDLDTLLGVTDRKPSILEVILGHKKKVGVKFDTTLPNIVDVYAGLEPSSGAATVNRSPPESLRLMEYKKELNSLLQARKTAVFVLFDRLDDFVVNDEYEDQRRLLEGLIATQTDYKHRYPCIRIRSFLRTDLFKKLDLSKFGPDKILSRTIELKWSPQELKQFVAKRIAVNLMSALSLRELQVQVDTGHCLFTREELARLAESKVNLASFNVLSLAHWRHLLYFIRNRSRRDDRLRNFNELAFESVITTILPRDVPKPNAGNAKNEVDLFDFLENYFVFGHGQATPRVILMYLNRCLELVRAYYEANADIRIVRRYERSEFPLFVKSATKEAYQLLQVEAWEIQFQWARRWESLVAMLKGMSRAKEFSYSDVEAECDDKGADLRRFLAFVTHTGLLKCLNEREEYSRRRYEFPPLFRG